MPNGDVIFQNFNPAQMQNQQGPLLGQYKMLDHVTATDVGWWRRWLFDKGSLEVTDSPTGTVRMLVSNAPVMPANGFTLTVGGTITADDVVTVKLFSELFSGGVIAASYTVLLADTTTTVATGIKAALIAALAVESQMFSNNEVSALAAAAFQVTSSGAVVTIKSTVELPQFRVTDTVSGAATETITIAQYNSGLGTAVTGTSLTANGLVQFTAVAQWFKVDAVLTGGGANAIVNGAI